MKFSVIWFTNDGNPSSCFQGIDLKLEFVRQIYINAKNVKV